MENPVKLCECCGDFVASVTDYRDKNNISGYASCWGCRELSDKDWRRRYKKTTYF